MTTIKPRAQIPVDGLQPAGDAKLSAADREQMMGKIQDLGKIMGSSGAPLDWSQFSVSLDTLFPNEDDANQAMSAFAKGVSAGRHDAAMKVIRTIR
jgi:hypothetical protein